VRSDYLYLDDVVAGVEPANLVVLATDSPLGRAFALGLALDIAADRNRGVLVFSLAASAADILGRGIRCSADPEPWPTGDGVPTPTLSEVRAKAKRFKAQEETPGVHVVDGLEPLWDKGERDPVEAERVIEGLRALSAELGLTALAVIPFSARSTRRSAPAPSIATLLAFEKADLALHFWGEEVYDWHATGRRVAELAVITPDLGSARICKLDVTENLSFCQLPAAS
jgi:replicative DNA helicase